MKINFVLRLLPLLPFGVLYYNQYDFIDKVSLLFLRDLLLFCLVCYLSIGVALFFKREKSIVIPVWYKLFSLFVVWLLVRTIFANNFILIVPFILRMTCIALVGWLMLVNLRKYPAERLIKNLLLSISVYFSIAFAEMLITKGAVLQGPSGQHYSKMIALTGVLLSISFIQKKNFQKLAFICFVFSMLGGLLCVQRGFILASLIGLVTVLIISKATPAKKLLLISLLIITSIVAAIGFGSEFIEYGFFEKYGPKDIIAAMLHGNFDISMVRTRGRLEIFEIVTSNLPLTVLGNGAGSVKNIIGVHLWFGKEPHNDLLMILYDYGITGLVLFLLFIITFIGFNLKKVHVNDSVIAACATTSISIIVALSVWMTFSNVLIYSFGSFVFSIIISSCYCGNNKCYTKVV